MGAAEIRSILPLMSGRSIFENVVRYENAHTQLLCNLMERSKSFRSLAFLFLAGTDLPNGDIVIHTQRKLEDNSCPDVKMSVQSSASEDLLVEVKVRIDCPLTTAQKLGYRKPSTLVFLAPKGWKRIADIPCGSKVKLWNDLAMELAGWLEKNDQLKMDPLYPLLLEFQQLLDLEFPTIRLTASEVQMLATAQRKDVISVALKLTRIVEDLNHHFDGLAIGDVVLTVENCPRTNSEYGFYIKAEGKYLLWIGMWSEADLLLGTGYQDKPDWRASKPIEGFHESCDYNIFDLEDVLSDGRRDAVQSIIETLLPILEKRLAGQ
jgi:hypothetical protein